MTSNHVMLKKRRKYGLVIWTLFFVNFINFFLEKPSVSIIIFTTECKEKERDLVNNKKNDAAKEGLSGNCKEEEFNNKQIYDSRHVMLLLLDD